MSQTATDSYILFQLAAATYALRTDDVQHMEMIDQITPVPNAAAYVDGVVFSRGQVIPALNLRVRFGFPRESISVRSRLIVVQSDQRRVGLIVDEAREFRNIPADAIQPPHESIAGLSGRYLRGIAHIGDRLIMLLDIAEVLNSFAGKIDQPAGADLVNA
jgi:purine-binding chemotaxis protein CheW